MPSAAELRALGQYVSEPKPGRGRQLMDLLGQTWPARAVRDTANAVGGYVHHVGESVAGRADPMAVEPAMDFSLAIGGPSLAMAPLKPGPGLFGGRFAQGADIGKLAAAREMDKAGGYADEILEKTGWFKDVDGHWKFEIDDSQAKFSPTAQTDLELGMHRPMGQSVEHDNLFAAYPEFRNVVLNSDVPFGATGVARPGEIGLQPGRDEQKTLDTLIHEIQHLIQRKEGFAQGGNPGEFRNHPDMSLAAENGMVGYRRLAGEVEARNAAWRRTMNAQDRVESPPWYTRDVQDNFIVRGQKDPDPLKGWLSRGSVPLGPRT